MATDYTLVCPFLTDDPVFAYGVEFGMLYARMEAGGGVIEDCFHLENQDRICVLASRLRWRVAGMEPWVPGWFRCRLEPPG